MLSLEGAIDLHVHAAPEVFSRIGDAVQIGKRLGCACGTTVFRGRKTAVGTAGKPALARR